MLHVCKYSSLVVWHVYSRTLKHQTTSNNDYFFTHSTCTHIHICIRIWNMQTKRWWERKKGHYRLLSLIRFGNTDIRLEKRRIWNKHRNQLFHIIRERRLLYQTDSGDNWYKLLQCNCISYSNSTLSLSIYTHVCRFRSWPIWFVHYILSVSRLKRVYACIVDHFMSNTNYKEISNIQSQQISW